MNKLIELLNEHTNGRFKTEQDLRLCIEMRGYCRDFIKWLVDNDKIDREKVKNEKGYDITRRNPDDDFIDDMESYDDEQDLYLLMLLAISDTPINDLISYLK